jgi:hypothetical protein
MESSFSFVRMFHLQHYSRDLDEKWYWGLYTDHLSGKFNVWLIVFRILATTDMDLSSFGRSITLDSNNDK